MLVMMYLRKMEFQYGQERVALSFMMVSVSAMRLICRKTVLAVVIMA
jgi:hypothetical protein